ncbi:tubulin-binding cofactor E [Leptinotarsa decemlineata]|uniref:tubulin-binding cofactor E n=1 Tax=Leptinotarsa decemlineata TaxID=7539 RepID=UPI003D30C38C
MVTEYFVGIRAECSGDYGTVKYAGAVEGYQGFWLGIDWDEPNRGKHNGTVKGKHYFHTRYPTSGSFVRREKLNFGQSLIEAITSRYGYRDNEIEAKRNEEELHKIQQYMNAPFLELVGFEKVANKQRDFQYLEIVNVRMQKVCSAGPPRELNRMFPNIREIDLSKNLLCSWTEVFNICSQLKSLYCVNISENLLSIPENCCDFVFPNITVLICGHMDLSWDDVIKISSVFPNVQELRVPFNRITDITVPPNHNFKKLLYLDLEGNCIEHWSTIENLAVIQSLEHLNIEDVKLQRIRFRDDSVPTHGFTSLSQINISNNLIAEWQSIGELNKLNKLEHLRFTRNPILQTENPATREQIVVARIKNLKTLNGCRILDEERRGAEYDYLKKYGLEWLKSQNTADRKKFLREHNRFLELTNKYGALEESELVIQPNILDTALISISIKHGERTIKRKLPPALSIQKLILLIQKTFKLQDRPCLTYVSGPKQEIKIRLDDEMKELGFYSIQAGDVIIVNSENSIIY